MEALILAAGVGARLASAHAGPKVLLEFGGRSLLARHLSALRRLGISRATLCLGHAAETVMAAASALEDKPPLRFIVNDAYREGSIRSLWAARRLAGETDSLLLMDADVLCSTAMIERLVHSRHENCVLMDRNFEPGDEPVKVRLREGKIVEFRKRPDPTLCFDTEGESVGFFRFRGPALAALWTLTDDFLARGETHLPHEEALRELFLADKFRIGIEDITGSPWMEIDYPADLERARREILPEVDRE